MIKYQSLEKLVKFDKSIADKIINSIREQGFCKEKVEEILDYLERFFSTAEYKEDVITLERKETNQEAQQVLGEKFVKQYQEILDFCKDNDLMLFIHGTSTEIAENIMKTGLQYKSPEISSTAISMPLENPDYSTLLNWPHRQYKGLVMVAISPESMGKFWRHTAEVDNRYSYNYVIDSEFLLGMIDIDNKYLTKNPNFRQNHDYSSYTKNMNKLIAYTKNIEEASLNTSAETKMSTTIISEKLSEERKKEIVSSCQHVFERCEQDDVNNFMEFALEYIICSVIKFSSEVPNSDWFRISDVGEDLFSTKTYAELLDKYKSKFITRKNRFRYSSEKNNNFDKISLDNDSWADDNSSDWS